MLGPVLWVRGEDRIFSYGGLRGRRGGWVSTSTSARITEPTDRGVRLGRRAPCFLVRREVFDSVGLLDERLFIYFEETELCLRATRAGWRVGVVLDAEAEQESGQAARPGLPRLPDEPERIRVCARRGGAARGCGHDSRRASRELGASCAPTRRKPRGPGARARVLLAGNVARVRRLPSPPLRPAA